VLITNLSSSFKYLATVRKAVYLRVTWTESYLIFFKRKVVEN
jgi:hypothetical protein